MEYRGIKIDDSVKLIKADGSYSIRIKESLDKLADSLESRGHELLDTYKGNKTEVLIDFKCGHEPRRVAPKDYKSEKKTGCDRCSGHSSEQAREDFLKIIEDKGHELLSTYIHNTFDVLIDFKCHHKPYITTPKEYKKKLGICTKCQYESNEWNMEQKEIAKNNLLEMVNKNEHGLLSTYIDIETKILIDFDCGHIPQWVNSNSYKRNQVCPLCTEDKSKGEYRVANYLKNNKISFKDEYTFNNFIYKNKLRFDFAVIKNRILHCLIEFDGEQHFKASDYMGGKEKLKKTQHRDKLKNDYCLENNIRLIRIKYTEYKNIEFILEKELLNRESSSISDVISFYPKVGYYDNNLENETGVVLKELP